MKYSRETCVYRGAEQRLRDWREIYLGAGVRRGLRAQAARCMECGVPFCQGAHGCPLGNIVPKWNDLVFKGNWQEALYHLLQTNNFPGEADVHPPIRVPHDLSYRNYFTASDINGSSEDRSPLDNLKYLSHK